MQECESSGVFTYKEIDFTVTSPVPNTRESLILRLPNRQDSAAWDEFAGIYQPLVYRLARAKGLQDADASELVQEVFIAVAGAVDRWKPGREHGRFRDWLFRISRNLVINFLTRRKHRPIGSGDSGIQELLNAQCDPASEQSEYFDMEYQREVFHLAASRVRKRVDEKAWQAFWQSTVDDRPIAKVATELSMSVGAVYVARSRILQRIRQVAQKYNVEAI